MRFAQEKIGAQNFIAGSSSVWLYLLPQKIQRPRPRANCEGEGSEGLTNKLVEIKPLSSA